MANFSLLRSAFQQPQLQQVGINNQGVLAQTELQKSKLAGALQLAGPSVLSQVPTGGGGRGGSAIPGISQQAIDKQRFAQTRLLNAQAKLTEAARRGKVLEYGRTLEQVAPEQSQAFVRQQQRIASAYMKNPAVAAAVGGK